MSETSKFLVVASLQLNVLTTEVCDLSWWSEDPQLDQRLNNRTHLTTQPVHCLGVPTAPAYEGCLLCHIYTNQFFKLVTPLNNTQTLQYTIPRKIQFKFCLFRMKRHDLNFFFFFFKTTKCCAWSSLFYKLIFNQSNNKGNTEVTKIKDCSLGSEWQKK